MLNPTNSRHTLCNSCFVCPMQLTLFGHLGPRCEKIFPLRLTHSQASKERTSGLKLPFWVLAPQELLGPGLHESIEWHRRNDHSSSSIQCTGECSLVRITSFSTDYLPNCHGWITIEIIDCVDTKKKKPHRFYQVSCSGHVL